MNSSQWTGKLAGAREFSEILRHLQSGRDRLVLRGVTPSAKPAYLAVLHQIVKRTIVYVAKDETNLDSLYGATAFYHKALSGKEDDGLAVLPALEPDAYSGLSPHAEILEERSLAFWKLLQSKLDFLFCSWSAVLNRLPDIRETFAKVPHLTVGAEYPPELLISYLLAANYVQEEPVTSHGSFSLRGGILDVFPPYLENPCRIEFFGDVVDSLREFSVKSQRSIGPIREVFCIPLREVLLEPQMIREWGEMAELTFDREEFGEFHANQVVTAIQGEHFQGIEYLLPLTLPFNHMLFDFISDFCLVVDEPSDLSLDLLRWKQKAEQDRQSLRSRGIPSLEPDELLIDIQDLGRSLTDTPSLFFDQLGLTQKAWTPPEGPPPSAFPLNHNSMTAETAETVDSMDHSASSYSQTLTAALGLGDAVVVECVSRPARRYHGHLKGLIQETIRHLDDQFDIVFVQSSLGKAERLYDILQEYDVIPVPSFRSTLQGDSITEDIKNTTYLVIGEVYEGFELTSNNLIVFGQTDVFDDVELLARPVRSKQKNTTFISDLRELKPGDYVVHIDHGIGQFIGLRQLSTEGISREFMVICFQGDDKIYVPLERLDLVQKYGSAEGVRPQLDKLGGTTWTKTKTRIRKSMRDMADELLKLYAERRLSPGFNFSAQGHWHQEFEEVFEFVETPDQAAAITDVYKDMESDIPMDRLLCGDVGFGKTEVAMRAAFKAAFDGKQVAVLAPTTVLVYQHYLRFKQRFTAFPMNIEMLSRFRSKREQAEIVQNLSFGKIDVIIGTHRLLSKDIQFRDLGLLIVDEEQQFGVIHKERLKQLKKKVDTLTMSATPIPRTLHMSLVGIRDMSIIETAPRDRLAIQTFVVPFSKQVIQTAIEQELGRGGQVYFVHNKVHSIYSVASMIQNLFPKARILVGHGQMGEKDLEKTMLSFVKHEADILVSTTIIENGLDIPLVNTLLVNRADRFGLAQLYQLRGRVGRSNRRAYAYLLTPPEKTLTGVARQRLAALKEFSELGSGFKIAALDLELRGAGNLLGGEQHGHINAIGFDLYCQMLERTIDEMQGNEVLPEIQTQINLNIPVKIPTEYVPDEHQRLSIYKRVTNLRHEKEMDDFLNELEDRYGSVPKEVMNLIDYVRLRVVAEKVLVRSIERERDAITIKFHEKTPVAPQRVVEVVSSRPSISITPVGGLKIQTAGIMNTEILSSMRSLLLDLLP